MSKSTKKDKDKDKEKEEEVEIIVTFNNEPSEQAIYNLNKEYFKILLEMQRDGRLD